MTLFRKPTLFPLIMATAALLCFLAVVAAFAVYVVQPPWGALSLLLLPALILGAVCRGAYTGKLPADHVTGTTVGLSALFLFLSGGYLVFLLMLSSTTVTTHPLYYPRALAVIRHHPGVEAVFPERIPAEAEEVDFTYWPAFLQGGECLRLSLTLPEEALAEWTARLESAATWMGSDKAWHTENQWSGGEPDATRYLLYWDGGFNHGKWSYVLIYPTTRRITFFFEDW